MAQLPRGDAVLSGDASGFMLRGADEAELVWVLWAVLGSFLGAVFGIVVEVALKSARSRRV